MVIQDKEQSVMPATAHSRKIKSPSLTKRDWKRLPEWKADKQSKNEKLSLPRPQSPRFWSVKFTISTRNTESQVQTTFEYQQNVNLAPAI